MKEITDYTFQWLLSKPLDITNFSIVTFVILMVLVVLYIWAFLEGRSISIWPPKIGAKSKPKRAKSGAPNQLANTQDSLDPWLRTGKQQLKPSLQGAKDLEQLIQLLGNVMGWLAYSDTLIVNGSKEYLWKVIQSLSIERLLYLAVYAEDLHEQLKAIRELSQIDDQNAVAALESIGRSISVSERVKAVAQESIAKHPKHRT